MLRLTCSSCALMLLLVIGHANGQQIPTPGSAPTSAAPAPAQPSSQVPAVAAEIPALPPLPDVGQESFRRLREDVAPLSPQQIREMGQAMERAERAAAAQPRYTPKVVSSSVVANLAPGATPPVVRLFVNHVTPVVFMDQLGNPLSIRNVDLGAPDSFTLTHAANADGTTNFFSLSPKTIYASGNIVVSLDGVSVPVVLTLISGQREVDSRVDVRVKGVTAKGVVQAVGLPAAAGSETLTMLAGMTPDGSRPLTTSSGAVQAWAMNDRFYVRTPAETPLLSPAFIDMVKAPDGSAVYVIPPTPVVVVMAGPSNETANVTLSGY